MTRTARFKQADATRALKAAARAGMNTSQCIIDPTGNIRLIFGDAQTTAATNPLDRLLRP